MHYSYLLKLFWSMKYTCSEYIMFRIVLQLDKLLPQQLCKSMYDDIVGNQNSFYMDS